MKRCTDCGLVLESFSYVLTLQGLGCFEAKYVGGGVRWTPPPAFLFIAKTQPNILQSTHNYLSTKWYQKNCLTLVFVLISAFLLGVLKKI